MTSLTQTRIGRTARALAAALALGGTILALSAGPAHAEPKEPADSGVRCARTRSNGHVDFYLPYESSRDRFGHWQYCGEDGDWHDIGRTVGVPRAPKGPKAQGGGVYAR